MGEFDIEKYGLVARIRSARSRKRAALKERDKALLRFHREERAIWDDIRNLGWTELTPPVQRGYVRFFVVREDVRRSRQGAFFGKILEKINTQEFSARKDFKKKKKKQGRKIYVIREQRLRDVYEKEFLSKKFTDHERFYFYEIYTHPQWSKRPVKVYRFVEPWRFTLKVQPYLITKVRVKDLDLERRRDEIGRYLAAGKRRHRLDKLLGERGHWKEDPEGWKYKSPFLNRAFIDILDEYWPEQLASCNMRTPGKNRGFFY